MRGRRAGRSRCVERPTRRARRLRAAWRARRAGRGRRARARARAGRSRRHAGSSGGSATARRRKRAALSGAPRAVALAAAARRAATVPGSAWGSVRSRCSATRSGSACSSDSIARRVGVPQRPLAGGQVRVERAGDQRMRERDRPVAVHESRGAQSVGRASGVAGIQARQAGGVAQRRAGSEDRQRTRERARAGREALELAFDAPGDLVRARTRSAARRSPRPARCARPPGDRAARRAETGCRR